jgi:hypothetical protein
VGGIEIWWEGGIVSLENGGREQVEWSYKISTAVTGPAEQSFVWVCVRLLGYYYCWVIFVQI